MVRSSSSNAPVRCQSGQTAVATFRRSGNGIENLKDCTHCHQRTAFLYAPLPTDADFGPHSRINREGHFGLDSITWRDLLAFRQFDETHAHVAVVRAEEVVVWSVAATAQQRRTSTAFFRRQKADACSHANLTVFHSGILAGNCKGRKVRFPPLFASLGGAGTALPSLAYVFDHPLTGPRHRRALGFGIGCRNPTLPGNRR